MKKYKSLIPWLFILSLIVVMFLGSAPSVYAQDEDGWTDPVNLSNSGSTTSPSIVIDSLGTIHVFWIDEIDGYKYVSSQDGIEWTTPKTVTVPFPTTTGSLPIFLAGKDGAVHVLWKSEEGALQYLQASSENLGQPSSWTAGFRLSDSVVAFHAIVDSQDVLHVSFLSNLSVDTNPAGIYYRRLAASRWSAPQNIYASNYFRSLTPENANIQVAASDTDDGVNVYIVWDDRSQRRIYLAKSPDGGELWDGVFQIRGPEDFSGLEMPYNVHLSAVEDQIVLIWQAGIPGNQCLVYSQWSVEGTEQFGQPLKILDEFAGCPLTNQFILSSKELSVAMLNIFGDLSFMAWNGSSWSQQQIQNEIETFINPVTLDGVFLSCQNASFSEGRIYIVGCDTGNGRDIWFSSRSIGSIDEWFSPPSRWTRPTILTTAAADISTVVSVADNSNNIHNIWVENSSVLEGGTGTMIQYARWDGTRWSKPSTVISGLRLNPSQMTTGLDNLGKLLLAWVDDANGDMFFSWANSERASSASEWEKAVYIPSVSAANSSPDLLSDASGRTVVAYAVLINEERGIYIVETEDFGVTWSEPYRIFDASAAGWDMVDRPEIALTGDGRLHVTFGRYSLSGEQRRSAGLYYVQSMDGGVTWSVPETVSEQPVVWSELIGSGRSNIHRIWQEQRASSMASIHQFSSDGGQTWGPPAILSTTNSGPMLSHAVGDPLGNLYFLQLAGTEEFSVLFQKWDGTSWKNQAPRVLDTINTAMEVSALVSSVTPNGHLMVSLLVDSSDFDTEWQSELLSMSQSLGLGDTNPTSDPALIPTAQPGLMGTPDASVIAETPTSSPLAGLQTSQSFLMRNRNMVGYFIVGGILILMGLLFWSSSRSKEKGK